MKELQIFKNPEFGQVRVIEKDGEPWFVAKDIADILEFSDTSAMTRTLEEDEKGMHNIQTLGGNQEMIVINEPGLYSSILRSRKPEAKQFKRWITHEVIPSIRKHGAYMTPEKIEEVLLNPDTIIQLATTLKEEQQRRLEAEQRLEQQKPKVLFADAVEVSKTSILVGDLAKIIKQNGYDIGQKRLFQWLRDNGYLIKSGNSKNMPTQKAMEMQLFEVKESTISNPDGSIRITKTTKVTGKGQMYFVNKFLSKEAI